MTANRATLESGGGRIEGPEHTRQRPRCPLAAASALAQAPPQEQAGDDQHQEHDLGRAARRVVPLHERLDHADGDATGEGRGQAVQAADHGRRQRP
jgi:hypothetical protein